MTITCIDDTKSTLHERQDTHTYDLRGAGVMVYCRCGKTLRITATLRKQCKKGYMVSIQDQVCRAILNHTLVSKYGLARVFMFRKCAACSAPLNETQITKALASDAPGFCAETCQRQLQRWRDGKTS